MRFLSRTACVALLFSVSSNPAIAAGPRDTLIRAAFSTRDKDAAIALVSDALAQSTATLARSPGDREAALQQALAIGYRGQLKRSAGDAKTAHEDFVALARADPRNAEVQVAIAGWHLTAVGELGPFLARTVIGASRETGYAALDRAVALGGNRAFFPAYAALIRLRLDPKDTRTPLVLIDRAVASTAPTPIDRIMQRAAARVGTALRAGDAAGAAAITRQQLPFGQIE